MIDEAIKESIQIDEQQDIPKEYALFNNYPNPFNPTTEISYEIPDAGNVNLTVYNVAGEVVKELVNKYNDVGRYSITFNANNLSSGIYFYRLQAKNYAEVKKMVLTK